jgi:queuine tRNA-ribosyltransferase
MLKILKNIKRNSVRLGKIKTRHGVIDTPFFMPDATRGFVKAIDSDDLKKLKMGPLVVNTFHLYLQPGMKIIKKAGGIHKFMGWGGPLLADSGGYQVFSLVHKNQKMGRITDKNVIFKSPFDGSRHQLTPEKSIQIQFDLGVDMMVCLDDCPPNDFDKSGLEKSVERTIVWAKRCRREYDKQIKRNSEVRLRVPEVGLRGDKVENYKRPLLFAVIQGGAEIDLRKYCIEELIKIGFDGYGFGARPVDKEGNFLGEVLKRTAEFIPKDSLRFALGIGTPEDIVRCASYGWDMFDCVIPTREGRHGRLFLRKRNSKLKIINSKQIPNPKPCLPAGRSQIPNFYETINILNSKFSTDFSPINFDSKLPELRDHSKAYLNHLFKLKDPLGARLATLNNLEFYLELMKKLREK